MMALLGTCPALFLRARARGEGPPWLVDDESRSRIQSIAAVDLFATAEEAYPRSIRYGFAGGPDKAVSVKTCAQQRFLLATQDVRASGQGAGL
jgi:two-component sensor histidine kinase